MSKNPTTESLNKYLVSAQRKYGKDFCQDKFKPAEQISGSLRYNGPEKGNKYGIIGDKYHTKQKW